MKTRCHGFGPLKELMRAPRRRHSMVLQLTTNGSGVLFTLHMSRPVPVSVRCKPHHELQHCLDGITDGAPGVDRYLYNCCIPTKPRGHTGYCIVLRFPSTSRGGTERPLAAVIIASQPVMPAKLAVSMRSFRHHLNQPDSWQYLLRAHPGSLKRLLLSAAVLQDWSSTGRPVQCR